uniref:Uncharacterized protein n=1 Tax=Ciona intestinalis TaxID=7719 RepID=H2XJG2_CIOIN
MKLIMFLKCFYFCYSLLALYTINYICIQLFIHKHLVFTKYL